MLLVLVKNISKARLNADRVKVEKILNLEYFSYLKFY
jgi:hypothetical protein